MIPLIAPSSYSYRHKKTPADSQGILFFVDVVFFLGFVRLSRMCGDPRLLYLPNPRLIGIAIFKCRLHRSVQCHAIRVGHPIWYVRNQAISQETGRYWQAFHFYHFVFGLRFRAAG